MVIRKIQSIFQFSRCKFSHLLTKSQYQSIMQFLIPKQRNFFSAAIKNNFNISRVDKLHTCVCYVLEIIIYKLLYLIIFYQLRSQTQLFSFLSTKAILNVHIYIYIYIYIYILILNVILNVHIFNNNLYVRFLKKGMYFSFQVLHSPPCV